MCFLNLNYVANRHGWMSASCMCSWLIHVDDVVGCLLNVLLWDRGYGFMFMYEKSVPEG